MTDRYDYTKITDRLIERFNLKYKVLANGCWHWTGAKDGDGYGNFFVYTRPVNKVVNGAAHRISWVIKNKQDWPKHLPEARHTCNNPSCVNPDHIMPGTRSENINDIKAAGNFAKPRWSCFVCRREGGGISNLIRHHSNHSKVLL